MKLIKKRKNNLKKESYSIIYESMFFYLTILFDFSLFLCYYIWQLKGGV